MKILKFLLIFLILLFVAWLVASLFGIKDYRVERSLVINANDSIVFNKVSKFTNWDSWSPWKERDPSASYTITGDDGVVGTVYAWGGGDPKLTGTGSMKLTTVNPNLSVAYDLHFTEPWEMSSTGGFDLEPAGENKTKLTWHDEGDVPFSKRFFMLFMNLDEMMGPDFERGLFKIDSLSSIDQNAFNSIDRNIL